MQIEREKPKQKQEEERWSGKKKFLFVDGFNTSPFLSLATVRGILPSFSCKPCKISLAGLTHLTPSQMDSSAQLWWPCWRTSLPLACFLEWSVVDLEKIRYSWNVQTKQQTWQEKYFIRKLEKNMHLHFNTLPSFIAAKPFYRICQRHSFFGRAIHWPFNLIAQVKIYSSHSMFNQEKVPMPGQMNLYNTNFQ